MNVSTVRNNNISEWDSLAKNNIMTIVHNKFSIGDVVYLKTDIEQYPRIVVSYEVFENDDLLYKICQGTGTSTHYEFEMSSEKNFIVKMNNG